MKHGKKVSLKPKTKKSPNYWHGLRHVLTKPSFMLHVAMLSPLGCCTCRGDMKGQMSRFMWGNVFYWTTTGNWLTAEEKERSRRMIPAGARSDGAMLSCASVFCSEELLVSVGYLSEQRSWVQPLIRPSYTNILLTLFQNLSQMSDSSLFPDVTLSDRQMLGHICTGVCWIFFLSVQTNKKHGSHYSASELCTFFF